MRSILLYDKDKCTLCGVCAGVCVQRAITLENGCWNYRTDLCKACGQCIEQCRFDALEFSGQVYTLEQVKEEILKDKAFYDKSKGGVTFSGGEILMQIEFAEHLSEILRETGIHIACETTAALPPAIFKRLLKSVDYVMLDIKHYERKILQEICRADLSVICENIKMAVNMKKTLVGRIPVIPGFNHSLKDMEGFACFCKELGVHEIHLLPFHQLGEKKYEQLQREYKMKEIPALHKEDMEEYAEYLRVYGFQVEIGG